MTSTAGRNEQFTQESAIVEASKIVCDGNLHQCLWLPQNNSHQRLRVTFSTTDNFSNINLPTLLFCGPMFSSRWMVLDINRLAAEKGVRVICTDRPGMGGSTRVPLKIRVQVWLETVPVLLGKLNVERVGLMCHSTGMIFALNTLYHLRDILDPRMPYVACMTPWVNNEKPSTVLMKAASIIPNSLFDHWHDVIRFAQQRVVPAASWSGGLFSMVTERKSLESSALDDKYGTTEEVGREVERLRMSYMLQEDITGADEDARLCLRKEGPGNWGICEDYAKFVRSLIELEQERAALRPHQAQLEIHAYFASSDVMIGKHGQAFFEQVWRQEGVEKFVTFKSWTLDNTTHDTVVVDPKNGALKQIFDHYAKSSEVEDVSRTQLEPRSLETVT